jgi:uncharacterized protein
LLVLYLDILFPIAIGTNLIIFAEMNTPNKLKIVNDPIYGFVSLPFEIIFDLIEHPYFQRLRRIKQLGLTNLVYPGALHTRFHHAIGAMHLMYQAIEVIRAKGHEITQEEAQGATIAILLHDIGHGPYSHALEHSIVNNISHEDISLLFMQELNKSFDGKLTTAIAIFQNKYKKKFLHQLVSSQLDVDRLDYLKRDSFFTGVSEGVISSERIIKMLNVVNDQLAVEAKGIYSIEKFIIARAKELAEKKTVLFCTPALKKFLYNKFEQADFIKSPELLDAFAQLDDYDIMTSIKVWMDHEDRVLSMLCKQLVNRKLSHVEMQKNPFKEDRIQEIKEQVKKRLKLTDKEAGYFVFTGNVTNEAYRADKIRINILFKDGSVSDIAEASDQLSIDVLARAVKKYYLCYPKNQE